MNADFFYGWLFGMIVTSAGYWVLAMHWRNRRDRRHSNITRWLDKPKRWARERDEDDDE